jgi:hypothetical protein
MKIMEVIGYFFLVTFALLGLTTTIVYVGTGAMDPSRFRDFPVGWQIMISSVLIGAVIVAYKTGKSRGRALGSGL